MARDGSPDTIERRRSPTEQPGETCVPSLAVLLLVVRETRAREQARRRAAVKQRARERCVDDPQLDSLTELGLEPRPHLGHRDALPGGIYDCLVARCAPPSDGDFSLGEKGDSCGGAGP